MCVYERRPPPRPIRQDKSIDVYGREDEEVSKQIADLESL